MKLSDKEWKAFKISNIFDVNKGIYLNKKDIINGEIPYISAKAINNGVTGFIGNSSLFKGNSITIEKVSFSAFYQSYEYYCSHDVSVVTNEKINRLTAFFICTMLKRQGVKYSYGRQAQMNVVKRESVFLPVNDKNEPDYDFMEQYIKELEEKKKKGCINYFNKIINTLEYKKIVSLEDKDWKKFRISDICEIDPGCDIYEAKRIEGKTPYITSSANNNGIKYFVSNTNKTFESNAISVNRNGSIGYAFYHKYKALYSNDCRKLKLKQYSNEYVALFLTNQIMQQKSKYNYGYKMGTGRLKRQYILLPINDNNEPDYKYMEQYCKNISYKQLNKYLSNHV